MTFAIPVADGALCMHFGHCQQFVIIEADTETRQVTSQQALTPPAHAPGVLPRWLAEQGVKTVIAGGMGSRAQRLFAENGITVVVGAPPKEPEKLVADYLAGQLATGQNVCDH